MENMKENVCGKSMKELNIAEMNEIFGGADADPRWTPVATRVIDSAVKSNKACLAGIASAVGGVVSYNKNCLG
ncbi:lichenicidin A2 family type 2 lantibiotic [Staphylococcus hominis]|uniref:lichenicidin A2 family type 2 lantibiotic n=1 Tax=Staphylococcus hominis TaxID=1290 RepID=UPI0028796A1D|nr:mersacidin family lantibiotic [Staphylococcus hominis]MDS3918861.1 mersacidin family lantibiotic [Staphylococcus hominis]